jgi:replication fork clamp-binding protein CrfC
MPRKHDRKAMNANMVGLSYDELQREIEARVAQLDEAQEEEEHLGPYGDLLRMAAVIAFQRAAELIDTNNRRIAEQLKSVGIVLEV